MDKMQTFLDDEMRDHLQGDHARFKLVSDADCVDQLAADTMYDQKKDVYPGGRCSRPQGNLTGMPCSPATSCSAKLASSLTCACLLCRLGEAAAGEFGTRFFHDLVATQSRCCIHTCRLCTLCRSCV